ncbi:FluC/FEX family fluoride channel [Nakamurella endophytica]|uniref:FluC/FEX family fluoride channel n=1 Tax=Nakamurella endophytica TaxID=1748367 RepID=UPI001E4D2116|nr:CrcB family protein [Nakamurella endophytica]
MPDGPTPADPPARPTADPLPGPASPSGAAGGGGGAADPVDPDLPPAVASTTETRAAPRTAAVVAVVAAGGILGALARYQAQRWWPAPPAGVDITVLAVNLLGCLVIGVLATWIADLRESHPLLRPFWVTGVLGGFTTFSTFAVEIDGHLQAGRAWAAAVTLLATAVGAVAAAAGGRAVLLALHRRRVARLRAAGAASR